jgi:chromosome segregation ATPase
MFFSKKTTSSFPGAEAKRYWSRRASPVDSIMSVAPLAAPSPAYNRGVFGRSSPTPSIASTTTISPPAVPATSDLALQNTSLQNQFDELKEVSDLNRSTLQQLAEDLADKDQECTGLRKSVCMLNAEQAQAAEIIKGKDDQLSALQIGFDSIKVSYDNLTHEHDQASRHLTITKEQVASLQHENNALAAIAAAAEAKVSKYNTHIDTFKQQYQVLGTFSAQEQQKHKHQVDAMHAQQSDAKQRFQAQLQVKDVVINTLQAQVKQSELTASKATTSREDEVACLKDQLHRATLDYADQSRQTAEWQELANEQRIRADALEAQVAELKAKGTVV